MNKLERGLEMSLIAIVNLEERSAYALSMHQSVEQSALKVAEDKLCSRSEELQQLSRHVVADGYYARAGFISTLIDKGFEVVTLLRRDASASTPLSRRLQREGEAKALCRSRRLRRLEPISTP